MNPSSLPALAPTDATAHTRLHAAGVEAQLAQLEQWTATTRQALRALADGPDGDPGGPMPGLRTVPRWHFAMLNDHERNDAFVTALERLIKPGMHVLDIGSGTGLLAMVAARAGAAHVTTCEVNPMLAEVARQVVARHGLTDRITVLDRHSTRLRVGRDLPRRADLLVSEIVDCGLVGEGLLGVVRHARRDLVRPDALVVPRRGVLSGQLVESEAVRRLNHADIACGFDVSLINALATPGHFPTRLSTWPHRMLSDAETLLGVDFTASVEEEYRRRVGYLATGAGTVHGVVAWLELDLGHGVRVRTSPDNNASHWMQAFIPLPEPVRVAAGDRVDVDLLCRHDTLYATASRVDVHAGRLGGVRVP